MSKDKAPTTELSETLATTFGDKDHEIFMSYGILTMLVAPCKLGLDSAMGYATDNTLQNEWLRTLTAPEDSVGRPLLKGHNIDRLKISVLEAGKIIDWAGSHVINFYLTRLASQTNLLESKSDVLQNLQKMQEKLGIQPAI